MRKQREEKGITLIALIITIIVLLILAGVSIAMLTGENGILKRAEGTEVVQAQAELTEEMQLAIMESLIDRDNAHTIDNVLQIAEANSYISINNQHTLMNATPESSEIGASTYSLANTNVYVTDDCTEVTVVDVNLGVWVTLGQEGTNVTITSGNGNDVINVADLRILKLEFEIGEAYTEGGKENLVDIKVKAILDSNSSKKSSYIKEIRDENGNELTLKDLEGGQNGDQNSYAIYTVESNGEYRFTALEEHGGKATIIATVSNSNVAKIEMISDIPRGEWSLNNEVKVTIEYDKWTTQSLQYKVGTGSWQTAGSSTEVVTVTENITIEARYGTDDTTKVTYTVAEIDTTVPTKPEFTAEEIGTTSFKINIGTISTDGQTGLKEYIVYVDGRENGIIEGTKTEYTVENLDPETTYEVKIVAVDEVGNKTESDVEEVTTDEELIEVYEYDTEVSDDSGDKIIVPAGFVETRSIEREGESEIDTGFVITDARKNEYVWVPAVDGNAAYDKLSAIELNASGSVSESVYVSTKDTSVTEPKQTTTNDSGNTTGTDLIAEFVAMKDSIENRGGFYIMRYEMSRGSSGNAESKVGVTTASSVDATSSMWFGLYALAGKYDNETFVNGKAEDEQEQPRARRSIMLANSQYDIMMSWMTSEGINVDEKGVPGTNSNNNNQYISGSIPGDKMNNIYDLRGSKYEWMTAAYYTFNRTLRGGGSGFTDAASNLGGNSPTFAREYFRVACHFNLVALATVY